MRPTKHHKLLFCNPCPRKEDRSPGRHTWVLSATWTGCRHSRSGSRRGCAGYGRARGRRGGRPGSRTAPATSSGSRCGCGGSIGRDRGSPSGCGGAAGTVSAACPCRRRRDRGSPSGCGGAGETASGALLFRSHRRRPSDHRSRGRCRRRRSLRCLCRCGGPGSESAREPYRHLSWRRGRGSARPRRTLPSTARETNARGGTLVAYGVQIRIRASR